MRRQLVAVSLVAALALAGAAVGALAHGNRPATPTVRVTEREYRISVSRASLPAGRVRLVIHNAGRIAHRLSIAGPGLTVASTPLIQPGATQTPTVTLGKGPFTLWCPLGHHAAAGMKTSVAADGAVAVPPVASVPAGTTTVPDSGGYDYGGGGY